MSSSNEKLISPAGRVFSRAALTLAVLSLSMRAPLFGEDKFGELNGRTTDASGAVLADVNVNVTNTLNGAAFTTKTLSDGTYVMRALDPGRYTVRFEVPGFAPHEYEDVIIATGRIVIVDSELKLRGPTQMAKGKRR